MKKLNRFLRLTVFASLLIFPFLIGCAETEREMIFPATDIPESATVSLDVPTDAAFKLLISTDYRKERDNFGNQVIVHNNEKEYSVTQDFSETILFATEEPRISVKLTCTKFEPINENSSNSVHLIIQFNGDGNFDRGNHDQMHPIELGTFMSLQSAFSRYEGTSIGWQYSPPN